MPSTLAEQTSLPKIVFTDTTNSDATVTISCPRPTRLAIRQRRAFSVNESLSGRRETITRYRQHVIEVEWHFVSADTSVWTSSLATVSVFRRLWDSCNDGTPFYFYVHGSLLSGYPQTSTGLQWTHKNLYYVRFASNMDELVIEDQENAKDRCKVTLAMEEVLT